MTSSDIEHVISENAILVYRTARRLYSRRIDCLSMDDLISAGNLGLIDATEKFNPSQGITFSAYARIRIRGAMLDEIRAMDWRGRSVREKNGLICDARHRLEGQLGRAPIDEEVALALGVSLEKLRDWMDDTQGITFEGEDIAAWEERLQDDSADAFHVTAQTELMRHVLVVIDALPYREQRILHLYYNCDKTMKEIGDALGYTQGRISQLHGIILGKLRMRLQSRLQHCFN